MLTATLVIEDHLSKSYFALTYLYVHMSNSYMHNLFHEIKEDEEKGKKMNKNVDNLKHRSSIIYTRFKLIISTN